jgi:hypothetical protein
MVWIWEESGDRRDRVIGRSEKRKNHLLEATPKTGRSDEWRFLDHPITAITRSPDSC